MQTHTVAVMLTDIAGFTQKTAAQTYEQNAAMLRRHRRLVHPLVRAYGGRIVKEIGDAVLATFGSPTRAVQAAMAIQDTLAQANRDGQDTLHLRVAINVGEVRVEKGDVFGEAVNVAARIEAETPVDHIYISGSTYLTMNRTGVPLEFLGQRQMKGVSEPVTLFAVPPTGPGLPYGGRELHALALRRKRRIVRAALGAAAMLACVALGALVAQPRLQARAVRQSFEAALGAEHLEDAADHLDTLATLGVVDNGAVEALLTRIDRMSDPQSACLFIDSLTQRSPSAAWLERRALIPVRLRQSFNLLRQGELAQARICMGTLEDRPSATDERLLDLLQIHHDTLLALRGHAGNELRAGLKRYEQHLRAGATPAEHAGFIVDVVLASYAYPAARPVADSLLAEYLRTQAAAPLALLLQQGGGEPTTRAWQLARLEDIGRDQDIDWLSVYAAQLEASSCTLRRAGIDGLRRVGDIAAVGVLMRAASSGDGCIAQSAKSAAQALVKNGHDVRVSRDSNAVFVAAR